jgi:hypothetical protein
MKFFCPIDFENDYLEAMNILEMQKGNQKENYNNENISEKNNKRKFCHEFQIIKENEQNNKVKNFNNKHKKKSSILEVIEYPYIENNKDYMNKNSKLNSDVTNINSETLLLMEYSIKHNYNLNQAYFSNINGKEVYNKNIPINKENQRQNDITKKEGKNIKYFDNDESSSDSLIINEDYNFSFISNCFNSQHNDKIYSSNFQQLKPIDKEHNLTKKIKKANSFVTKKNHLINKKKQKTYNKRNYSNLFPKQRYSRDTIFTHENTNKSGTMSQTLIKLTQRKKIQEIPKIKKIQKSNQNIIINKNKNKIINKINKFINKSHEKFEVKKNINKSMNNNSIKSKQSENKYTNKNNKKNYIKCTSKNKKRKYLNSIPINKNTNINLFIITNTKNIFEEANKLISIKRNCKTNFNLTEV